MWDAAQAPLLFGLIAAFVTSIGLVAVALRADWSERHSGLFALAAGGMLLTLTLLHIAPEAFAHGQMAPRLILAGFLGGLALSHIANAVFAEQPNARSAAAAVTPIVAVGLHSFLDGAIYAVTFATNFESGVYAAMSLILHEFPEGVIAFAILRRAGVSNRRSLLFAFLAAAATTPLGVLASAPFLHAIGPDVLGVLFGLSAGLLLFVATGPLMAPLREERPQRGLPALGAGVGLALAIAAAPLPHVHNHDVHHHHEHGPAHPLH
ncbi:MAG: ZIP family metal transporter [Pseudomonadota bacterium]